MPSIICWRCQFFFQKFNADPVELRKILEEKDNMDPLAVAYRYEEFFFNLNTFYFLHAMLQTHHW